MRRAGAVGADWDRSWKATLGHEHTCFVRAIWLWWELFGGSAGRQEEAEEKVLHKR